MYVTDEGAKLQLGLFLCIKFLPLLNPFQVCSQRNVSTTQQELKYSAQTLNALNSSLDISPNARAHPRAASSVEAHHCVNSPDTGRNSGGRRMKKFAIV